MFLSRLAERQAGHDRKVIVIDSKKAELTNVFCAHFFSCICFHEI